MILRLSKLVFFVLAISLFNSCKLFKINNAYKEKHIASLPNLNNYIKYSLIVNAKSTFTIKSITLNSKEKAIDIDKYDFINLKTNAGHAVLNNNQKTFMEGNYLFGFKLDDDTHYNINNESLEISIESNGKTFDFKDIKIEKRKIIFNK